MAAALGDAIAAVLAADPRRILVTLGGRETAAVAPSARAQPRRTIVCGRAEQTALLASVGLAAEGWRPILLLPGALYTGRAGALLEAFCAGHPPDILLVCPDRPFAGVAAPRGGQVTSAADEAQAADLLPDLVSAAGPRVLVVG